MQTRVGPTFTAVALIASSLVAKTTLADEQTKGKSISTVTHGAGRALAILQTDDGIFARSCATAAKCSAVGGSELKPPESALALHVIEKVTVIHTSGGQELAEIRIEGKDRSWVALAAAGEDDAPRIVFNGWVGEGVHTRYAIEKDGAGQTVRVGASVRVCDQDVTTERKLDGRTLEFIPGALNESEKAMSKDATELKPEPAGASASFPLLSLVGASSGRGSLAIDGDPATAWRTNLPVGSEGEFLSFELPKNIATTGLRLTLGGAPGARSPGALFFTTEGKNFKVKLPEGEAQKAYQLRFPAPLHTRCLAVMVGKDDGGKNAKASSSVALPEIEVSTSFDGKTLGEIASSLGAPGNTEKVELLSAVGSPGVKAAIDAYPKLDTIGRDMARRIVDAGACKDKFALYVPMLTSQNRTEVDRARDHIERCGKESVSILAAALALSKGEDRLVYAEELALLGPEAAVPILVKGLASSEAPEDRLLFRKALVKASARDSSVAAFDKALAQDKFAALNLTTKIDLLRGIGGRIAEVPSGREAVHAVWKENESDFRTSYLLLGPTAALARTGDPDSIQRLSKLIGGNADDRLRVHAAELSEGIPDLQEILTRTSSDKSPRVREASLKALGSQKMEVDEEKTLIASFPREPWTFVKRAALAALAAGTKNPEVNAAIATQMLSEEQPAVREEMLRTLGARKAKDQHEIIVTRMNDGAEMPAVRIAAAMALGDVCDVSASTDLFTLAHHGQQPATESDAKMAIAAIISLGKIQPDGLANNLAPLLADTVVADVRDAARAAIAEKNACKR